MTATPPPPPLHATALHRALRRARRVWWGVALARAAAVAALAALAVLPAAWLRSLADGVPGALLPSTALALPALALFATVFAAAVAVAAWRAPTLLALAQRADRVLGQAQRLSTAYEVLARRDATSTVAAALVDEAEGRAVALDWTPVGRVPWWRFAPLVFATASAVALAAAVVPVPQRQVAAVVAPGPAAFDADRAARDAATVERFAALLDEVATQEGSPYLQAVATSFADLAERLEAGTIDAAEADRVLEELVGHLEAAARGVSGRFGDAIEAALARDALGGGADGSASAAASEDGAAAGGGPDPAGVGEASSPPTPPDAARGSSDASMYMALQDLANEIANDPGSMGLRSRRPPTGDDPSGADIYGGALQAATDPNAAAAGPSGQLSDAAGAGDAVGAAERSSDRAGDVAGGGSAALGGGADAFLDLEAEGSDVAVLPWNERADGRFVEVELVPDAVLGEARAFARATPDGPFRRSDEAASTARSVGAAYREVVSRYFLPGAVRSGGAP
jgi:hypothetical protein